MNSNCKIGIVENEEFFRMCLKEELLEYENTFIWKNAEDCYRDDILQNLDILLVDIGLPDIPSFENTSHLRNLIR